MEASFLNFNLYQVQLFLLASECGSFTKTAKIANTTQSTVSKSIASLEKDLGFQLFVRESGKVSLTSAGAYLAKEWKGLLSSIESSVDHAAAIDGSRHPSIAIGEPDSMKTDRDYLPAIERYRQEHPDVEFTFAEWPIGKILDHIVVGDLDAAFTIDYELPKIQRLGLRWAPISDSPLLQITMHKGNPLASSNHITLEDLRDQEFVVPSPAENESYINYLQSVCREHGFEPHMEIQVPNFRSAISTILRTGNGVMLANRFIYDADSDQLINFGIDNTCSKLIIVWAEDPKDPQTTSFCNFMASEYVPRGERGR